MTSKATDYRGLVWHVNDVVLVNDCEGPHQVSQLDRPVARVWRDGPAGHAHAHWSPLSHLTLVRHATADEWPCAAGPYPFHEGRH